MQKYSKRLEYLANFGEISAYALLKLNINQVTLMSKFDLSVADVRYLPMYEEYVKMRHEGLKVTHIICHLAEKYLVSESSVKRVVKRLSQKVQIVNLERPQHTAEVSL